MGDDVGNDCPVPLELLNGTEDADVASVALDSDGDSIESLWY